MSQPLFYTILNKFRTNRVQSRELTEGLEPNAAEQAYLATNNSDDFIIIHRSRLVNRPSEKVNSQLLSFFFIS